LQLWLSGAGLLQALAWVFFFPWPDLAGPAAFVFHMISFAYAALAALLVTVSLMLLRGRHWAWRLSWAVARLAAVVLVVVPIIGIVEAPRGAPLYEPLRMLAWAGPALLLAALLSAARASVER
jgi:hypothetical protein